MKRINRRVFTLDCQNVPVIMSHDDFIRLRDIVDYLCHLSNLDELFEMKEILFYVSTEIYQEDLKQGLSEKLKTFDYYEKN